jgi:hypothetical protein
MKISTNKINVEVTITTDECELLILKDGLEALIPFVQVNDYFDKAQIDMVRGMIKELVMATEALYKD